LVHKRWIPVVAAVLAAACGSGSSTPAASAAQAVSVGINPTQATVAPGGQQAFTATVSGTANTAVTWSVLEGDVGGTIDTSGLYSAPGAPGTYHVVATSQAAGTASASGTVTVAGTPMVVVTLQPQAASLPAGGSAQFTATVTGTSNTAVTWSLAESSGCGSVNSTGLYTAPQGNAVCHVVATSKADATKSASAAVSVGTPAVTVAVSPSSAAVDGCGTVALSATVTGSSNAAVTWSVQEGASGGSITPAGVYTAPSTNGVYHAVATSQANGAASATAALTVTNKVLSVALSPSTVSLSAGATAQFTATVNTSCGPVAATQVVTAQGK